MRRSWANTAVRRGFIGNRCEPGARCVSTPSEQAGGSNGKPERKRLRELEKELRRKDRALAEAAALLVLRKKAAAIWGEGGAE